MIRVGIIGCGKIAQVRHIPEYLDNPEVVLKGFYDINFERAQELAEKYNAKAYESYEDMLADDSIDAVSVCAANHVHAEISIAAMNAGKHVLCEKPMAITLEECEQMVEAAEKNHCYLMIGQNQRIAKAHIVAKELLRQGAIGKPLSFRTTFGHSGPETWSIDPGKSVWFFDPKQAAMGAMADLGIHKTDLIHYLFDGTIVEVTSNIVTLDKRDTNGDLIGVDDNAICIYKLDNGVVGTMTASWTFYGKEDNSTVIYGTGGIMRIYDNQEYAIILHKKNGEEVDYKLEQIQTNDNQTKSGIIDEFVNCLVKKVEPEISGKEVLKSMKAVFASIESSNTGKTVRIN